MTFIDDDPNKTEKESPFTIDPTAAIGTPGPSAKPKPLKAEKGASSAKEGGFIGRQAPKSKEGDFSDDQIRAMRRDGTDTLKKQTAVDEIDLVELTKEQKMRKMMGPALTIGATVGIGIVLLVAVGMLIKGMVGQYEAQNSLRSARAFLKQGNAALARRHLEPLIKDGIKDPALFSIVGICSNKLNEPQRALNEFDQAAKLEPKEPAHLCGRAEAFLKLDKPQEAINESNSALKLNPNYPDAFRWRAAAYLKQSEYDKSIEDCDKYLKVATSPTADVYATRGASLFSEKKFQDSAADYTRAVQIEPENGEYWTAKAVSLQSANEFKDAVRALNRSLEVQGKKIELLRRRADCLLAAHDFDGAIKDYELVGQLTRTKEDYVRCADVAMGGKRYNLAFFYYTKALEADPNDNKVRAARETAGKAAGVS